MTKHPLPTAPPAPDLSEMLRQALSGLLPPDPLAWYLDRMEGRR